MAMSLYRTPGMSMAVVPSMMLVPQPSNQLTVQELRASMNRREESKRESYIAVLDRCYSRIRRCGSVGRMECTFEVPNMVPGLPLFDREECYSFDGCQKATAARKRRHIRDTDVQRELQRYLPDTDVWVTPESHQLYQRAMVHRSELTGGDEGASYERLEFLGDAVLSLVVASYLYKRYPDEDEGFLTRMRTKLVNGRMLARLCSDCTALPQFVVLASDKALTPSVLEDVFEAFLGAVFLDRGFGDASRWLVGLLEEHVDFAELVSHQESGKAVLHRHYIKQHGYAPMVVASPTPGCADGVTVQLLTPAGAVIASAAGITRRDAEDAATRKALQYSAVPGFERT